MSEQGKIQRYYLESVDSAVEASTDSDGDWCREDDVQLLEHRLATAATAATEYAQQAAELQEEVGRLRGASLVLAIWVDDVNSSNSNDAINFKELNEAAQRILDLAETETE